MPYLGNFNNSTTQLVNRYHELGWSCIPLRGGSDPSAGKIPALRAWKAYQYRLPSSLELHHWFGSGQHQTAGIVLGTVSKLVVIDIDDAQRAQDFATALPDLTDTLTIKSGKRGLPHYYFALPDGLRVPSRSMNGVELRSDGQYVVGAGMCIGDACWRVCHDREPRKLTGSDLRRILAFMRHPASESPKNRAEPATARNHTTSVELSEVRLTPGRVQRLYARLAPRQGRNNALFAAARFARDNGWSEDYTRRVLLDYHVSYPSNNPESESPYKRRGEGIRTIASVFSKPATVRRSQNRQQSRQLPNVLREYLLGHRHVNLARVLDGLLIAGLSAGDTFTTSDAVKKLAAMGIGRNTIYRALALEISDLLDPSPHTPHPPPAGAAERSAWGTNQCLFGRVTKRGKNRGRPQYHYQMPCIETLCKALGLKPVGGDALEADALRSPAAYRAALHGALIKRSPGRYARRWQARRLGVSMQTCRRYDRRENIVALPTYQDHVISWREVDRLLCDEPIPGRFLQDETGRRYPALPFLARRLLAQGRRLLLRIQDVNAYHHAADAPQRFAADRAQIEAEIATHESKQIGFVIGDSVPTVTPAGVACDTLTERHDWDVGAQHVAPARPAPSVKNDLPSRRSVRPIERHESGQSNAEDDRLSDRLYDLLRQQNPERSLTRKRVERLVSQYDQSLLQSAIQVLKRRRNIRNPAGFLLAWLRSETAAKRLETVLSQNNLAASSVS